MKKENKNNHDQNKKGVNKKNLRELMKENLKLNREMHEMLKSVKTHILIRRIVLGLKILIILIPIALGVIYLPPLVQDWMNKYKDWLRMDQSQILKEALQGEEGEADLNMENIKERIHNLSPQKKRELLQQLKQ